MEVFLFRGDAHFADHLADGFVWVVRPEHATVLVFVVPEVDLVSKPFAECLAILQFARPGPQPAKRLFVTSSKGQPSRAQPHLAAFWPPRLIDIRNSSFLVFKKTFCTAQVLLRVQILNPEI